MRSFGSAPAPSLISAESLAHSASGPTLPAEGAEAIYEKYFDFVWRNARRLGVREEDVDDAVQEVFIVVHRRVADFEARSSMETWLFGILLRVVQHYRRSKARRLTKMEALVGLGTDAEPSALPGPHEELSRRQQAEALHRLLDELDDDKRATFVLVELEERTVPEVAAAMNVNVNTVYSRLRAARLELEKAIARRTARDATMAER